MKPGLNRWNNSLTNRLAGTFFIFLFLTAILVGWLAYGQATRSLTDSVFDRLGAVATLKEDSLNRWIDQQRLNIVFTAFQPTVQQQAGTLLDDSVSAADRKTAYAAISDYLKFVVTSVSDSSELLILDLNGKVVLSTLPDHEGQSHAGDPFFIQGMFTTFIQPVYKSPESGHPTISRLDSPFQSKQAPGWDPGRAAQPGPHRPDIPGSQRVGRYGRNLPGQSCQRICLGGPV
jgi:hypothetical protein